MQVRRSVERGQRAEDPQRVDVYLGRRFTAKLQAWSVVDDLSHFIVAWKLCTTMKVADMTATVDRALVAAGRTRGKVFRILARKGRRHRGQQSALP
jgi:hypothetical protein